MASRDIKELKAELQEKYWIWEARMNEKGIPFLLTCTSRSILEQVALYVQGRLPLVDVNRIRWVATLPLLTENENRHKVTWTLNSRHITNMFDNDLSNDFAEAWDFAVLKQTSPKKIEWSMKADVNQNEIGDYEEAGRIAEALGLVWGGRWKNPDYCHIQMP